MTFTKRMVSGVCAVMLATLGTGGLAVAEGSSSWIAPEAGADSNADAHARSGERKQVEISKVGGRYKTLNDAIRAAGPNGIVNIEDGTYTESLVIDRPIKLTARRPTSKPDSAEKTYYANIYSTADAPCLTIELKHWGKVEIENLNLVASPNSFSHGCIEVRRGDVVLKNSRVYGATYTPAILVNGGKIDIDSSSALNGREGLFIAGAPQDSTFNITKSTFANNTVGIRVLARADVNLYENNIRQNTAQGIVYYLGYGSIAGNVVCDNGANGVEVQIGPEMPQLRDNVLCRNLGNGLVFLQNQAIAHLPVPPREIRDKVSGNYSYDNVGSGFVNQTGNSSLSAFSPNCFEENARTSRSERRAMKEQCKLMQKVRKESITPMPYHQNLPEHSDAGNH